MTEAQVLEKLDKFKNVIISLKQELEDYKKLYSDAQNTINSHEKRIYELQSDLSKCKSSLQENDTLVEGLLNTNMDYQNEAKKSNSQLLVAENAIIKANELIRKDRKEIKELDNKNKSLLLEISSLKEEIILLKTENKKQEDTAEKDSSISKATHNYRLGRTTEEILKRALKFIDELYFNVNEESNVVYLNNEKSAKEKAGLSDREFDVFIDRLTTIKYDNEPLIKKEDDRYVSSFKKNFIKDWVSNE